MTDVRYDPSEQYLRKDMSTTRVRTPGGTYIRSYAGVIFPRSLLFLPGVEAASVRAYYGRSVLQVVGCFVVEGIGIGLLGNHLNIHARLRVLDDNAQVHLLNCVFPFRSP